MLHKYIHTAILATSWTHLALAKSSEIVPQDLQTAFESSDVEIQAAFGGDAVDGFDDGTTFEKNSELLINPHTTLHLILTMRANINVRGRKRTHLRSRRRIRRRARPPLHNRHARHHMSLIFHTALRQSEFQMDGNRAH
jgi:hypothetical protein